MRGYWVWRARPGPVLVHGIPAPSTLVIAPGANTIGVGRPIVPNWELQGPIRVWRLDHFRETTDLRPRHGYLIYSNFQQTLSW